MRNAVLSIGVMLSGGGRSLQNLIDCIARGELAAQIRVVISSLSKAGGVAKAHSAGLPVAVVRKQDYPDEAAFSNRIAEILDAHGVQLACQAGWMCHWRIPRYWQGRVMNIHPSLLPKFGGQGFYGHRVHEAVLAAGEKESGCTVHYVTDEYDAGPIILQRRVPVLSDDTADSLAARVFEEECIAYPQAIRQFAACTSRDRQGAVIPHTDRPLPDGRGS